MQQKTLAKRLFFKETLINFEIHLSYSVIFYFSSLSLLFLKK